MNTNTEKYEATITPHIFGETLVRTTTQDGEILFCAIDVCTALCINNNRQALTSLHEDERADVTISDVSSKRSASQSEQKRNFNFVTEPGLYRLIFKSRKAEAETFKRWVFHEVLPAIRRNGVYGKRSTETAAFIRDMISLGMAAKDASILARHTFPPMTHKEAKLESLLAAKSHSNQKEQLNEELKDELQILELMEPNAPYSMEKLFKVLPSNHRAHLPSTVKGKYTCLGSIMRALVTLGKVEKIPNRHALYRRISETSNIIQIK